MAVIERSSPALPPPEPQATLPVMCALHLIAVDGEARTATVAIELPGATREVSADIDASVSLAVLHTALQRGERIICQQMEGGALTVIGALRTTATPGVDRGETFRLEADRVIVAAEHEIRLRAGDTSLMMRALGQIEVLGRDVTSRARGIHKLVGRVLKLN